MPVVVERAEFLLEHRAVAEQRHQSLVFGRRTAPGEPSDQPAQVVTQVHAHQRRLRGQRREAVTAVHAVVEPLVQQHVAQPALAEGADRRERMDARPGCLTQRPQRLASARRASWYTRTSRSGSATTPGASSKK